MSEFPVATIGAIGRLVQVPEEVNGNDRRRSFLTEGVKILTLGLCRQLVPTMAKYLLRNESHGNGNASRNPFVKLQHAFEAAFERLRGAYSRMLESCLHHRRAFLLTFFAACLGSLALIIPWLGQDFFPDVDAGSFKLHISAVRRGCSLNLQFVDNVLTTRPWAAATLNS